MPNSRHREAMLSPSLSRITKRIRSSITDRSFHGIPTSAPCGVKSVTHVSGTFCYPCLGTVTMTYGSIRGVLRRFGSNVGSNGLRTEDFVHLGGDLTLHVRQ